MIKRQIRNINEAHTREECARHARIRGEMNKRSRSNCSCTVCPGVAEPIAGNGGRPEGTREALGLTLANIKAHRASRKETCRVWKTRRTPIQRLKH